MLCRDHGCVVVGCRVERFTGQRSLALTRPWLGAWAAGAAGARRSCRRPSSQSESRSRNAFLARKSLSVALARAGQY